jgi:hypothetical protein
MFSIASKPQLPVGDAASKMNADACFAVEKASYDTDDVVVRSVTNIHE